MTTIVFAEAEAFDPAALFRNVLPSVEELAGFKGMVVFSGLEDRTIAVLTLWQTADALRAAEPVLENVKRAETSFRQVKSHETTRFYVAGSRLLP